MCASVMCVVSQTRMSPGVGSPHAPRPNSNTVAGPWSVYGFTVPYGEHDGVSCRVQLHATGLYMLHCPRMYERTGPGLHFRVPSPPPPSHTTHAPGAPAGAWAPYTGRTKPQFGIMYMCTNHMGSCTCTNSTWDHAMRRANTVCRLCVHSVVRISFAIRLTEFT